MRTLILIFITAIVLPGILFAGAIRGKVSNGTMGFSLPDSLVVVLNKYVNNAQDSNFRRQAVIGKDGMFYFKGLPENETVFYEPMVFYQGVKYYGKAAPVTQKTPLIQNDVAIYETTRSDSNIVSRVHHLLMKPETGKLHVQEMLMLDNQGDRTFIGPDLGGQSFHTLDFYLPKKAANLQVNDGLMSCCIQPFENGFYNTMELMPGTKQVVFSYQLDAPESELKITKKLSIPTRTLDILSLDPNVRISGGGIVEVPVEKGPYKRFVAAHLEKGEEASFTVSGLPGKPDDFSNIAVVGFAFLLVGTGFYFYIKRRKNETQPSNDNSMAVEVDSTQQLIQEIARLDEAYEAKQIEENEYKQKREQLKSSLEVL